MEAETQTREKRGADEVVPKKTAEKKPAASKTGSRRGASTSNAKTSRTPRTVEPAITRTTAATNPTVAAAEREHPESKFPISRGNHADIACADCHSLPGKNSKANVDCVQCHKRSRYDRIHARVSEYPLAAVPANFCVVCHTKGTRTHN